jgi:hypothetical protein
MSTPLPLTGEGKTERGEVRVRARSLRRSLVRRHRALTLARYARISLSLRRKRG